MENLTIKSIADVLDYNEEIIVKALRAEGLTSVVLPKGFLSKITNINALCVVVHDDGLTIIDKDGFAIDSAMLVSEGEIHHIHEYLVQTINENRIGNLEEKFISALKEFKLSQLDFHGNSIIKFTDILGSEEYTTEIVQVRIENDHVIFKCKGKKSSYDCSFAEMPSNHIEEIINAIGAYIDDLYTGEYGFVK